jgi:hypothetical protein
MRNYKDLTVGEVYKVSSEKYTYIFRATRNGNNCNNINVTTRHYYNGTGTFNTLSLKYLIPTDKELATFLKSEELGIYSVPNESEIRNIRNIGKDPGRRHDIS